MRDIITHQRETKWLCVSYLHCFALYFCNSLLRIKKIKGENIVLKIKKNKTVQEHALKICRLKLLTILQFINTSLFSPLCVNSSVICTYLEEGNSRSNDGYTYVLHPVVNTVELQWLEHLWDHENMFEAGVVRANEG